MKQTITAQEQELNKIFSDDYLFEIPEYQRPYAWTTEQAAELLEDLIASMGDGAPVENVSPYFLGSIVLIKDPAYPRAQVVDGQQRLTTLTILVCVLRELADDEEWHQDLDTFVRAKGSKSRGTEDRFRLSLRKRDKDVFRDKIQAAGKLPKFLEQDKATLSDAQRRMYENALHLWNELKVVSPDKRELLSQFLTRRCYLVVVSASDQNSAYRIFSVMNDRGLDLSPTDILKADIVGAMPESIRSQYTEQWEDIEEELGREEFKDLFAHIRMIYAKSKQRGTLNLEFRDGVLSKINGREFIENVLKPYAEAYGTVSRAAHESTGDAEQVNIYLRHLNRLDNYDWAPAAIDFFKRFRDEEAHLIHFIRDLERLAYALFITRANINERIKRYASVLRTIEDGGDLFSNESPLQLADIEKANVRTALDGPIYLQTRVRMPLLLRIDDLLADNGASYEHKVISIEHVLPQNPASGSTWLSWFPEDEVREGWTHKLANLVLLSRQKNSQAQNYEFERKKTEYFQRKGVSTFAMTSQVLIETEWTLDVLKRRQERLVKLLTTEWRLH